MKKSLTSIIFTSLCLISAEQDLKPSEKVYASHVRGIAVVNDYIETAAGNTKSESISSIMDTDNNSYKVVRIGNQIWMAENLKTTRFNDGGRIPVVYDGKRWSNLVSPGYCWYNNDALSNKSKYGVLYNGYSVSSGKLCPSGWHVPSADEWKTLISFVGEHMAGGKLKETDNWMSPNEGATNITGFAALPGGSRGNLGSFMDIGLRGHWWSTTENANNDVISRTMSYSNEGVINNSDRMQSGLSVRCMKDN